MSSNYRPSHPDHSGVQCGGNYCQFGGGLEFGEHVVDKAIDSD